MDCKVISSPADNRCTVLVDDVYVGNFYLTDIKVGKVQYHIFIGNKNYWGKGVAKQVPLLILDSGFQVL